MNSSMNTPEDTAAFPGQFARTQRFSLGVPRAFTVSPDGARVLFLRTRGGEDRDSCLWLWQDGTELLLAGPELMAAGTGDLPEAERIRRERARERATGVVGYATDAAVRTAAFALDGQLWVVGTDGSAPRPVPTAGPVVDPRPDPAGRRVAYVTGGALHVVDLTDGTDRRLAAPQGPADAEVTYGLAEHVAAESMGRHRGYWWAPDGTRLLVARVDTAPVGRWFLSDPAQPQLPPREIAYPAAGTANADVTLWIVGLDGRRTEVEWDRDAFEYLAAALWDAHGPLITLQSRDQRNLDVYEVDPDTGRTAHVHLRRDKHWVELVPGTPARLACGSPVLSRERDGTRELRVHGASTPPGLQLRAVLGVDGQRVLFSASEEPTEVHVWRYAPDGGFVRLSEGPGVHTAAFGGPVVVLHSHTMDGHTVTVLRDGEPVGHIASLAATPRLTPRITWLRAGEREVRTALLLPTGHAPGSRKLPVLLAPYSGPGLQLATRARHWWLCEAQWFAEAGFAVVVADGRGTPGRGPAWEKAVRGDTLDPVIEDQVAALHAAAEHCRRPGSGPDPGVELDLDRVAIRGWSYGGSLAAAAVMRRPDVFHAGVAGAPVTDQRLYDTHWKERFLGHPDQEPENYRRSSPIGDAAALRRPLLLVHGLADDNAVVAHTLRLSAALLAAGRPHQVLPLSGSTHMPTDETTVANLLRHQLEFLRTALNAPEDLSV